MAEYGDIQNTGIDIVPVTPSDSTDLTNAAVSTPVRALSIAVGGDIKITTIVGQDRTVTVTAGILPIMVKRVWSTGTTATGISAIY